MASGAGGGRLPSEDEAARMDTNASIPRRWSVEVDGIRWLPRMTDKARMHRSGRLGAYLLGFLGGT